MEGHKACRQIILPFVVRLSELWCESRQGSCAQRHQGSVITKLAWCGPQVNGVIVVRHFLVSFPGSQRGGGPGNEVYPFALMCN